VVYRAHTLHWPERVYTQMLGQVQRWRDAGNPVVGIQIDFDARTQYLHEYADFLRDLRQRLPAELRLSITGLMDWSSNADPAAIAQGNLAGGRGFRHKPSQNPAPPRQNYDRNPGVGGGGDTPP
uniref:DUF3142 domain-containing protein n=1 Tax=Pseudomonas viridiflava TaxID=33069 RepID=UPI001F156C72